MNGEPVQIFVSYAHEDEALRADLNEHLALLRREGAIRDWQDLEIAPGQEWEREIFARLAAADVILLLISSAFLASDFCYNREMARAIERHQAGKTRVLPVILRPCDWEAAPFGRLQALPESARPVTSWKNRDEAFLSIARGIRRVVQELRDEPSVPRLEPGPLALETMASIKPRTFWQKNKEPLERWALVLGILTLALGIPSAFLDLPGKWRTFRGSPNPKTAVPPLSDSAQYDPCAVAPSDTGFAEIKVNLDSGTFDRKLPIGVPLRLCGNSSPEITKVQVFLAHGKQPLSVSEESCKSLEGSWQLGGQGGSDGIAFRVILKQLEEQRFYFLCILLEKSFSPEARSEFGIRARATLDASLAAVDSHELSREQIDRMRGGLRQDLEFAAIPDQVIVAGTLFDPGQAPGQVHAKFLARVSDVLESELRRATILTGQSVPGAGAIPSYGDLQLELRQALDELRSSLALKRLAATLEADFVDELALVRITEKQASRLASGLAADGDAGKDLALTTDSVEMSHIADNYRRLWEALSASDPNAPSGLEKVIRDALGDGQTSNAAAGLSAEDRQSLQQLSQRTIRGPMRISAFGGSGAGPRRRYNRRSRQRPWAGLPARPGSWTRPPAAPYIHANGEPGKESRCR